MARDIEAQHGRFWRRCDQKGGFGSELRNYVLKKYLGREAAFNMGKSLKNGASVVTQLALVHFLFVHVLRR